MTWNSPRRDEVLRAVVEEADRRLDGVVPMDVAGVQQTFRDADTLADVLYVRWQAALAAEVERALSEGPDDPEAAVVRAWRRTIRALPGVRMVLDTHAEQASGARSEKIQRRRARQHQWLAQQAGLAPLIPGVDEEAVLLGADLEEAGRRYYVPGQRPVRPPLLKRLRAALAA
ncbi:hypothetical protein [Nocardioides gilvus]|uniref:hypothetical protein n=1 Tax=Nocardioides gilvus TaxID=1735589 RepID=UPI000D74E9C0|nr:hypothetical protein [Nocardioides gilvus]